MFGRNLATKFNLLRNIRASPQLHKRYEHHENLTPGTSTYDGDGKTTATILNNDHLGNGFMINSISKVGFRLNNDVLVVGPLVIFPR